MTSSVKQISQSKIENEANNNNKDHSTSASLLGPSTSISNTIWKGQGDKKLKMINHHQKSVQVFDEGEKNIN